MKRMICILSILLLIISLNSCGKNVQDDHIVFYYPKRICEYGSSNGVIGSEKTELNKNHVSTEDIIKAYLNGSQDSQFSFPLKNDLLIQLNAESNTLRFAFSDSIAMLPPTELTVSLASLAMTCIENSLAEEIHISAESVTLNGELTLIYTAEDIILWDDCIESTATSLPAASGE